MSQPASVPGRWVSLVLEEAVDIHDNLREPVNSKERATRQGEYPYYGATGRVDWIDDYKCDGEYVLLGEDGAPFLDPSRPTAYLVRGKFWVNNHAHILKGKNGLFENRFLLHLLNSLNYRHYVSGTTRLKLTQGSMRKLPLVLPSIQEQLRIVAKLDELFSELDAGVAALERAQATLKRYRASVLKAAVEGKLTEEWRQENPPDETGEELLERILVERRKHWEEEQLAKFKAQGRKPPKNWQQKYKEPVEPNTSELPELPEGWCWATAEQLGEVVTGTTPSTSDPANYGNHLPFFKPTDLDAGYRTRDARQHLSEVGASRCRGLPPLTVLVTCIGATIGKTGLARIICATNQQINALVPTLRERMGPYLFWYFTSPGGQQEITGRSAATTLPILNKGRFSKIPVPIPPLTEQDVLVGRLDAVMSAHEGIADTVDISRQRIFAIRQSILRCAFDGRLVPQDPNDEPASLMLERIRIAHEVERPQKSRH